MDNKINIGLIGTGIMGKAHSNAYIQTPKLFDIPYKPVMKVAAGIKEQDVRLFAEKWGWESYTTDWHTVIERKDIDIIDVATPNSTHYEIAMAALDAGKIVLCEKPLALNIKQAEEMVTKAEKSGKGNMVWFNFRRVPAITLAKKILEEERLGAIYHYRGGYLQDWAVNPNIPTGGEVFWRFDFKSAGSGVTGDLLSHSIDTALWLNGEITSVVSVTENFVSKRFSAEEKKDIEIKVEDASFFLCKFSNGSIGRFDGSRVASGRKNQKTFEINGEKGSLVFDLEDMNRLLYYNMKNEEIIRGWDIIGVTEKYHPYMKSRLISGSTIGYEHTFIHTFADFLTGLKINKKVCPDFSDGFKAQKVCDAVLSSSSSGKWIRI